MSQQDEERRAFEKLLSEIQPRVNLRRGAGYYRDPRVEELWKLLAAPEHEKAAPTAEPVAWMLKWPSGNAELHFVGAGREWVEQRAAITIAEDGPATITSLYSSPPPASDEQRERLARLRGGLETSCYCSQEMCLYCTQEIARDLAALCAEIMGQRA